MCGVFLDDRHSAILQFIQNISLFSKNEYDDFEDVSVSTYL